MIKKILIASRGEIAVHIAHVCAEMGTRSVAVYSEADRHALHIRRVDEAHSIGTDPLAGYLNPHALVNPAMKSGCNALHPGCGSLSENAELTEICAERDIKFIDPLAQVIRHMGDKTGACRSMIAAGVPCTPGTEGNVADLAEALHEAKRIGYPVVLKVTSGGGGCGIHRCNSRERLEQTFPRVTSEATRAFGNVEVFLKKCVVNPKHIETQTLADSFDNTVHLFERGCSIQRHNQKLIEIAPNPQLTPEQRAYIGDLAMRAAKVVGYGNTGTVELLLADGEVYSVEINTRVQVEHIITEEITSVDVVHEQICIASGLELSVKQDDIVHRGYALQFRTNAEDSKNNFLPSLGKITRYYAPGGPNTHTGTVIYTGYTIPSYYDSMCLKLIVWTLTWEEALDRGLHALDDIHVQGVRTTAPYCQEVLRNPEFRSGQFDTNFIESHPELTQYSIERNPSHLTIAIATIIAAHADLQGREQNMGNTIQAKKTGVIDIILRNTHQPLLAARVHTEDMLPICGRLGHVGHWSLEVWGGTTFDAYMRFLKEDPWERLRKLKAALLNTRLQMLLRGQDLLDYHYYSDGVVRAFVAKAAVSGIDVFRIFDVMSDVCSLRISIEMVKAVGKRAQGTICYTTSPVYTIEAFVAQGKAMADTGVNSIAIEDITGLLTPYATGNLVKALKNALLLNMMVHSHDTAGIASMCQLKAVENGADRIDAAISSMAWGTSHPGAESMVAALRDTPCDTGLDLELVQEIGTYSHAVRKKYHQLESEFTGVNTHVQVNQVSGGMISNLANQLEEQSALNRVGEVLEEIPRVHVDLGFPPLVMPTSQIVDTQTFFNVLASGRYKTITNEVKLYLQGYYGKAPGEVSEQLRHQAIGSEEVIDVYPASLIEPELNKLRNEIGNLAKSEEDVLTYVMFPNIGHKFLKEREAGTLKPGGLLSIPAGKSVTTAGAEGAPTEFIIGMCGETYHVGITGVDVKSNNKRHFYLSIDGMPEEVVSEPLNEYVAGSASGREHASEPGHVSTTMPGDIVGVLVREGDSVRASRAVLITETMKMETEVQAGAAGAVKAIYVAKGDRVNPGEILIEITG